jgi:hypothetical protein
MGMGAGMRPALAALALPPVAALLLAAAPTAPVRDAIIAHASALSPQKLVFTRTITVTRRGPGGQASTNVRVDRWDGRQWQLLSVDGKPPSADAAAEAAQTLAAGTVPGYHNFARLLAGATPSRDKAGNIVLTVPQIPAGMVRTGNNDISENLAGQALVTLVKGKPMVSRFTVTAREAFKINMMTKVTSFRQTSDYQPDASGTPRLVRQQSDTTGEMFGVSGSQSSETVFAYR